MEGWLEELRPSPLYGDDQPARSSAFSDFLPSTPLTSKGLDFSAEFGPGQLSTPQWPPQAASPSLAQLDKLMSILSPLSRETTTHVNHSGTLHQYPTYQHQPTAPGTSQHTSKEPHADSLRRQDQQRSSDASLCKHTDTPVQTHALGQTDAELRAQAATIVAAFKSRLASDLQVAADGCSSRTIHNPGPAWADTQREHHLPVQSRQSQAERIDNGEIRMDDDSGGDSGMSFGAVLNPSAGAPPVDQLQRQQHRHQTWSSDGSVFDETYVGGSPQQEHSPLHSVSTNLVSVGRYAATDMQPLSPSSSILSPAMSSTGQSVQQPCHIFPAAQSGRSLPKDLYSSPASANTLSALTPTANSADRSRGTAHTLLDMMMGTPEAELTPTSHSANNSRGTAYTLLDLMMETSAENTPTFPRNKQERTPTHQRGDNGSRIDKHFSNAVQNTAGNSVVAAAEGSSNGWQRSQASTSTPTFQSASATPLYGNASGAQQASRSSFGAGSAISLSQSCPSPADHSSPDRVTPVEADQHFTPSSSRATAATLLEMMLGLDEEIMLSTPTSVSHAHHLGTTLNTPQYPPGTHVTNRHLSPLDLSPASSCGSLQLVSEGVDATSDLRSNNMPRRDEGLHAGLHEVASATQGSAQSLPSHHVGSLGEIPVSVETIECLDESRPGEQSSSQGTPRLLQQALADVLGDESKQDTRHLGQSDSGGLQLSVAVVSRQDGSSSDGDGGSCFDSSDSISSDGEGGLHAALESGSVVSSLRCLPAQRQQKVTTKSSSKVATAAVVQALARVSRLSRQNATLQADKARLKTSADKAAEASNSASLQQEREIAALQRKLAEAQRSLLGRPSPPSKLSTTHGQVQAALTDAGQIFDQGMHDAATTADVTLLIAALGVAEQAAADLAQQHQISLAAVESQVSELQDALEAASWEAMQAEARCVELQLDCSLAAAAAAATMQLALPAAEGLQLRADRSDAEIGRLQQCRTVELEASWKLWNGMISQLQEVGMRCGMTGPARVGFSDGGGAGNQLVEVELSDPDFKEVSILESSGIVLEAVAQHSELAGRLLQRLLHWQDEMLSETRGAADAALLRAGEAEESLAVLQLAVQRQQGERRAEVQALEQRHRTGTAAQEEAMRLELAAEGERVRGLAQQYACQAVDEALAKAEQERSHQEHRVRAAEAAMTVRSRQADVLAAQLNEALRSADGLRLQAAGHTLQQQQLKQAEEELVHLRGALRVSSQELEEGGVSRSSEVAGLTEQRDDLLEELERAQAQSAGMACNLQEQHDLVGRLRKQLAEAQKQADPIAQFKAAHESEELQKQLQIQQQQEQDTVAAAWQVERDMHAASSLVANSAIAEAQSNIASLTSTIEQLKSDSSLALTASQSSQAAATAESASQSAQLQTLSAQLAVVESDARAAQTVQMAFAARAAEDLDSELQRNDKRELSLYTQLQELQQKQAGQLERLVYLDRLESTILPAMQSEVLQAVEERNDSQQEVAFSQQLLTLAHQELTESQQQLNESHQQLNESQLQLGCTQQQLEDTQQRLDDSSQRLGDSQRQLDEAQQHLAESHQGLVTSLTKASAKHQLDATPLSLQQQSKQVKDTHNFSTSTTMHDSAATTQMARLEDKLAHQCRLTEQRCDLLAHTTSQLQNASKTCEQQQSKIDEQRTLLSQTASQLQVSVKDCEQQHVDGQAQQELLSVTTLQLERSSEECVSLAGQLMEAKQSATWWEGEAEFLQRRVEDAVAELAEVNMRAFANRQASKQATSSAPHLNSISNGGKDGHSSSGGSVTQRSISHGSVSTSCDGGGVTEGSNGSSAAGGPVESSGCSSSGYHQLQQQQKHYTQPHVQLQAQLQLRESQRVLPTLAESDASQIHSGGGSCCSDNLSISSGNHDERMDTFQSDLDRRAFRLHAGESDTPQESESYMSRVSHLTGSFLSRVSENATSFLTPDSASTGRASAAEHHVHAEMDLELQILDLRQSVLLLERLGKSVAVFLMGDGDGRHAYDQQGILQAAAVSGTHRLPGTLSALSASCHATAKVLQQGLEHALDRQTAAQVTDRHDHDDTDRHEDEEATRDAVVVLHLQAHTQELQALVTALSHQQTAAEARIATLSKYRSQLQEKVTSLEDQLLQQQHRLASPSLSASPPHHHSLAPSGPFSIDMLIGQQHQTHLGRWHAQLTSPPLFQPPPESCAASTQTTHQTGVDVISHGHDAPVMGRQADDLAGAGASAGQHTGAEKEEGLLWEALSSLLASHHASQPGQNRQGVSTALGAAGEGLEREGAAAAQGPCLRRLQPQQRHELLAAAVEALRLLQEQHGKMVRVLRKLSREGPRGVVGQLEGLRVENKGLSIRYTAAQLAHQQCQRALSVLVDENRGMAALVEQLQATATARHHIVTPMPDSSVCRLLEPAKCITVALKM